MDTLDDLRKTSLASLQSLQSHEIGFPVIPENVSDDASPLKHNEATLLELLDRHEDLELQLSILETIDDAMLLDSAPHELEKLLQDAEVDALEAKTAYSLRNKIVEQAIMTHPALRAVHSGENADLVEKRLLPLILRRDIVSTQHANRSAELLSKQTQLSNLELENLTTTRKNASLTQELLVLAEEAKAWTKHDIADVEMRQKVEDLEKDAAVKKARWRIVHSVVSGVVVGSGIDWASDPDLVSLVLEAGGDAGE